MRAKAFVVGLGLGLVSGPAAVANPQGPQVTHGQASFAQPVPSTLSITNSPGAIINWRSFSIGAGEVTRFVQSSAASSVLNRVVGQDLSAIYGQLLSNGRVFLINPNGIVVGPGGVIDTAGFVASTLGISDADFKAGRYRFDAGPQAQGILNEGVIRAGRDGEVILIAPDIENGGTIETDGGRLVLAAGRSVVLTSLDDPDIRFEVQAPDDQVVNLGELIASGGAARVLGSRLRNAGLISADRVTVGPAGEVVLSASRDLRLEAGGVVSASAANGAGGEVRLSAGQSGASDGLLVQAGEVRANGGTGGRIGVAADRILSTGRLDADGATAGGEVRVLARGRLLETQGAEVSARGGSGSGGEIRVDAGLSLYSSGSYDASGAQGGAVRLLGREVKLAAASVEASGDTAGGTIRVGGGRTGGEGLPRASLTQVSTGSVLRADARAAGRGGSVVVYSNGETTAGGRLSARGGSNGGDGGFVEVSGKIVAALDLKRIDLSAPAGKAGTFLLDPRGFAIGPGGGGASAAGGLLRLLDPNPGAGDMFGQQIFNLTSTRMVAIDSNDDLAGADSGAAYLFDLGSGALLSALLGAAAGDRVGSGGVQFLGGANTTFLIRSPEFGGTRGAVTMATAQSGVNGTVSAANSLLGAAANDRIGSANATLVGSDKALLVQPTFNGNTGSATPFSISDATSLRGAISASNSLIGAAPGDSVGNSGIQTGIGQGFVLRSTAFNGGAGALTFGTSTTFPTGVVSGTNSLVGASAGDNVGNGAFQSLFQGDSVLRLPSFAGGAGAVAFYPAAGRSGVVGAANALVGAAAGDNIGSGGIQTNGSGNYLVLSPSFNAQAGALTIGSAASGGVAGVVSATNSLVGKPGDNIGSGGLQFLNFGVGTFVLLSPQFANGAATSAGAVTFGSLATGLAGTVGPANSLVGASANDNVGGSGIQVFPNGNYLVPIPLFDDGSGDEGAIAFSDLPNGGTMGVGVVGRSNALIGAGLGDNVGSQITSLSNGNRVFRTPGFGGNAGAVTLIKSDPAAFPVGLMSASNSLVGASPGDNIASGGVQPVGFNSNFIVLSPAFAGNTGAATLGLGAGPFNGVVDATNSLVGAAPGDLVGSGGIINLNGGDVLLHSPAFGGNAGALTFGLDDNTNIGTGTVSATNSLIGASPGDNIGSINGASGDGIFPLNSGNYAVLSPQAGGGFGAVTFGDAFVGGAKGTVGPANSLLGAGTGDAVGSGGLSFLNSGNALVLSPQFASSAGAVTFFDQFTGLPALGTVAAANSLVGASAGDLVGSGITNLGFAGAHLIRSTSFGGTAGALTFGDGFTPVTGTVGPANSLVGNAGDNLASGGVVQVGFAGDAVALTPGFAGGAGAVTFIDGATGPVNGTLGSANSLVGAAVGDAIGSGGVQTLSNGDYLVLSPSFSASRGAITFGDLSAGGIAGQVGAANSLIGAAAGDMVGSGNVFQLNTGNFLVGSPQFNGGAGAVTFGTLNPGVPTGTLSAANSLVGAAAGDGVGSNLFSSVTQLSGPGNFYLRTAGFNGGASAMTLGNTTTGLPNGTVSAANSLVGSGAGDNIGSSGVQTLDFITGNHLIRSPGFANGAGAVTFGTGASGVAGVVSAANSLVGAQSGDAVGSTFASTGLAGNTAFLLVNPQFNGNAGAVTQGSNATGVAGTVSAANSLVGAAAGDQVGSGGRFTFNSTGNVLVLSPLFNGGAGAVTFGNPSNGLPVGVVSASNSLVGAGAGDNIGGMFPQALSQTGNALVSSTQFGGTRGSVTLIDQNTGRTGVVSEANSLVGSAAGDMVGSNGVLPLNNGNYAVLSQNFGGGRGAITIANGTTGGVGFVSSANSVVGSSPGDAIGSGGVQPLSSGDLLVRSPLADNGGLVDAGRMDILSQSGVSGGLNSIGFNDQPGQVVTLGAGDIGGFLSSGASLTLQVNEDITLQPGASIVSTGQGTLTFEAGRDILLQSNIQSTGPVTLIANSANANTAERGAGPGEILIDGVVVSAASIDLMGTNITIQGGSSAALVSTVGDVTVTTAPGGTLALLAGLEIDSDALIIANNGNGTVNLTFGRCVGCDLLGSSENELLTIDPFDNGMSDVGIFAAVLNLTQISSFGASALGGQQFSDVVEDIQSNLLEDDEKKKLENVSKEEDETGQAEGKQICS